MENLGLFNTFKRLNYLLETRDFEDLKHELEILINHIDSKTLDQMKDKFPELSKYIIENYEKQLLFPKS